MKYFVFSIDDGTVFDEKVVEVFNRNNIRACFNLNSGLQDFVWYKDDKPVNRLNLWEKREIYANHEVCSHSLTHPHLTMCDDWYIEKEVKEDFENLANIFGRKIEVFAFPFHDWDERCVEAVKRAGNPKVIRLSLFDNSFRMPKDRYHIPITTANIREALELFDKFVKDPNAELFVFVSHGYDFEFNNTYDELDKLCKKVLSNKEVKIVTTSQLAEIIK